MTEPEYAEQITSRCESLGTWRDEFASTRTRLAKIYVRIDVVEAEYERTGAHPIVTHTNKVGAKNAARNPFLVELDTLYDQALTYERELGLTPAALRKINEDALKPRRRNGLEQALRLLEG